MRKRYAFTLIELLVVVSIIAVLISILVPSLKEAREQAKTVVCASNLKQIGLGVIMYAQQMNDKLPPMVAASPVNADYWNSEIMPFVGNNKMIFRCPSIPVVSGPTWVVTGKILFYPDYIYWYMTTSYGWNCKPLTWDPWGDAGSPGVRDRYQANYSKIKHPGQTMMIADGSGFCINFWNFWQDSPDGWQPGGNLYHNRLHYRHNNTINLVYVDGHVGRIDEPVSLDQNDPLWTYK